MANTTTQSNKKTSSAKTNAIHGAQNKKLNAKDDTDLDDSVGNRKGTSREDDEDMDTDTESSASAPARKNKKQ